MVYVSAHGFDFQLTYMFSGFRIWSCSLKLQVFPTHDSGISYVFWLSILSCFTIHDFFMAFHRFPYSVTFRHGFGFLNYVKDLFSALRFTFCIYCYVPALNYATGFPFLSHVSRCKSNIRFGYLYSYHNFVSVNYVLEYLLSHPYDLLCMFL